MTRTDASPTVVPDDAYVKTLMERRNASQVLAQRESRPHAVWREERVLMDTPVGMHTELWYGARPAFLRILATSAPGTLGHDLVRMARDLPAALYGRDLEIDGDAVRPLAPSEVPTLFDDNDDEEEYTPDAEVAPALERLPLVDVDAEHHFVKTCYFGSEIANLQRCAGSPFTVQLLGRSSAAQLVFARHGQDLTRSWPCTVGDVKCLLLRVVRALAALHARGVIHRDLVAPNVLLADDGSLVLCDLEGQLSSVGCRAPELWVEHPRYTPASDVFAFGTLMWSVCFHNNPRMLAFYILFPVPPPFETLYLACLQDDPARRPSLEGLAEMLEAIPHA